MELVPAQSQGCEPPTETVRELFYKAVIGHLVVMEYYPEDCEAVSTSAEDAQVVLAPKEGWQHHGAGS